MNLFQIFFIPVFLITALAFLIVGAKKDRSVKNRILWCLIWVLGAVAIAAPEYSTRVAVFLGIGRGTDLFLYIALILGLIVIRYFYLRMKRLESHVTILARHFALGQPKRGIHAENTDESNDK